MAPRLRRAYLALGSNLGDSRTILETALRELGQLGDVVARSSLYRTPPMGPPQPWYLNAAAALDTELEPETLLIELKRLEQRLGRGPGERWGARIIDLDLLLIDDLVMRTPSLTLPHPELHKRSFVLVPLAELAPKLRHPTLDRTIEALRDALPIPELAEIERLDSLPDSD